MARMVRYRGRYVPVSSVLPTGFEPPGTCGVCGGLGEIPETIDDEQWDVMVPCFRCRRFCAECRKWVKKDAHDCKELKG